jgi:hypothetical protein
VVDNEIVKHVNFEELGKAGSARELVVKVSQVSPTSPSSLKSTGTISPFEINGLKKARN